MLPQRRNELRRVLLVSTLFMIFLFQFIYSPAYTRAHYIVYPPEPWFWWPPHCRKVGFHSGGSVHCGCVPLEYQPSRTEQRPKVSIPNLRTVTVIEAIEHVVGWDQPRSSKFHIAFDFFVVGSRDRLHPGTGIFSREDCASLFSFNCNSVPAFTGTRPGGIGASVFMRSHLVLGRRLISVCF